MRKIIQLILLAILSGCATTQNYELVLSSWVGRDEIELIRGWGPPRQTYESAGSKFLVGGFKFEAQHALKIDGILLKVF